MTRHVWTLADLHRAECALARLTAAGADPDDSVRYRVVAGGVEDIRAAITRQARDGCHPWDLSHGGTHYTEAHGRA